MKYVNETTQSVMLMVCEKHAKSVLEKLSCMKEGNWFVLPPVESCRMGYWANVSEPHEGRGVAIFGVAESVALSRTLAKLAKVTAGEDGGVCPDCAAYGWNITPSHIAATAKDVVCGREVPCSEAVSYGYKGELFFFCSFGCRDKFVQHPGHYVRPKLVAEATLSGSG